MGSESVKKRIIFYFYVFENYKDNYAIKIHLQCLRHYSHVFDEAFFVISVDDVNNTDLIMDVERELLSIGFKDVRFKVHKNNPYCESQVFFDEIAKKLDYLDGLTFFAHTKGITNINNDEYPIESIEAWIFGLYYFNLNFIDEVERMLIYRTCRFYGAFLVDLTNYWAKMFLYSGTFYWLNAQRLVQDNMVGKIKLPTLITDRGFAETFPGSMYREYVTGYLTSHNARYLFYYNFHKETHETIPFLCEDDENGEQHFRDFIEEIKSKINP